MNKQIRLWLSLLFLLAGLPSLTVFAAESQIYTIKQGDTLWGVSERFVKDPNYWPSLWANNPEITNPHLIYPGQKVRLYNGRIELIPEFPGSKKPEASVESPAPNPVATAVEAPVANIEVPTMATEPEKIVDLFKVSLGGESFIRTDEKPLGFLVDSVDVRVLLTQNDLVFLNMENPDQVEIGDTYSLFGPGPIVKHPITKKELGRMMLDLGFVQITAIKGRTVVGKIGEVYREIVRGAEVFEYIAPTREIELKKAEGELAGIIVAGQQSKLTQAQNDVIYVDLGQDQGLQVGNILYISRPRHTTKLADIALKSMGRADKTLKHIELPDTLLGAAVVIKTRNQSAAALIFKNTEEMHVGDKVMAATE